MDWGRCLHFFAGGTELGKYKIFNLFLFSLPLVIKIPRDKALDHFKRGYIYQEIKKSPGIRFSDLKNIVKMGNGTICYHLKVLEELGYIESNSERLKKRFWAKGATITQNRLLGYSELQLTILEIISNNPGIVQRDLLEKVEAKFDKIKKTTLNYNVMVLKRDRIISEIKTGRKKRLFIAGMEEMLYELQSSKRIVVDKDDEKPVSYNGTYSEPFIRYDPEKVRDYKSHFGYVPYDAKGRESKKS